MNNQAYQAGTEGEVIEKDDGLRITLYIRSYGGDTRKGEIFERMKDLEKQDKIDEVRTRTFPEKAEVSTRSKAVDKYVDFDEWAKDNGIDLEPFFKRDTSYSSYVDQKNDVVKFPTLSIAVHRDQELKGVYPHKHEGDVYTVENFVSLLESQSDGVVIKDKIASGIIDPSMSAI